jgi:hypothetical protein
MAMGQLLGGRVIQNFRGGGRLGRLAKIVNTIFNAQFFSQKNLVVKIYIEIYVM